MILTIQNICFAAFYENNVLCDITSQPTTFDHINMKYIWDPVYNILRFAKSVHIK